MTARPMTPVWRSVELEAASVAMVVLPETFGRSRRPAWSRALIQL